MWPERNAKYHSRENRGKGKHVCMSSRGITENVCVLQQSLKMRKMFKEDLKINRALRCALWNII